MTAADFYNSPVVIEAFGKSRTFEVIRHLRNLWPDFPRNAQSFNPFHAAWTIYILSKCREFRPVDVGQAINDGAELRSDKLIFNVWFGELLADEFAITKIKNIHIFQSDNLVHVTPNVDAGRIETLIFQGKRKAARVDRSAILPSDFLMDIHQMLIPIEDPSELDERIIE